MARASSTDLPRMWSHDQARLARGRAHVLGLRADDHGARRARARRRRGAGFGGRLRPGSRRRSARRLRARLRGSLGLAPRRSAFGSRPSRPRLLVGGGCCSARLGAPPRGGRLARRPRGLRALRLAAAFGRAASPRRPWLARRSAACLAASSPALLVVSSAALIATLAEPACPRKVARRRELAELVADHRLGDEHGHVLAAVVDGDRVARPSRGRSSRRATRS